MIIDPVWHKRHEYQSYYSVKLTCIEEVRQKYLISASLVGFAAVLTQNILAKQNQWKTFVSLKD